MTGTGLGPPFRQLAVNLSWIPTHSSVWHARIAAVSGSVLADGFGLVGYAVRPPSMMRIAGLLLVVIGVLMVAKFSGGGAEPVIQDPMSANES